MSHGPASEPQILLGHTQPVSSLVQLGDGCIASGSNDGTVRVWLLDRSALRVLKGHTG